MNRKLLSLLVTLVAMFGCLGTASAEEATITLAAQSGNISNNTATWSDDHATFTLSGGSITWDNSNKCYTLAAQTTFTLTWKAKDGNNYLAKIDEISVNQQTYRDGGSNDVGITIATSNGYNERKKNYSDFSGDEKLNLPGAIGVSGNLTLKTEDASIRNYGVVTRHFTYRLKQIIIKYSYLPLPITEEKDVSCIIFNSNIFQKGETTDVPYGWNVGVNNEKGNSNYTQGTGDTRLEAWSNQSHINSNYYQTISGVPNGRYKVSALCHQRIEGNGGIYIQEDNSNSISANSKKVTMQGFGDDESKYETITTEYIDVTNNTITFGMFVDQDIPNGKDQWFTADDFKLTYFPFVKEREEVDDVITVKGFGYNKDEDEMVVVKTNTTTVDLRGATGSIDVDVTANPNALIYTNGITVNKTDNVIVNGSCDNLVLVDGYPFRAAWQFEADNAKYTMTAVASNSNVSFGTIMIPFAAASMPDGVKIYALDKELNFGNEILATSTTSVAANKPLLVTKAGDYSAGEASVAATQNTYTNGKLTGTYSKIDTAEEGSYVLQKHDDRVAFFLVGNASQTPTKPSVNPFRAYVTASQANGAKARFISVMFDDESTGILQIAEDGTTNVGRGQIYDLMGRKVVNPSNGIYVVNGKKVFIK